MSVRKTPVRVAKAQGFIELSENTMQLITENAMKKGDVLTVAKIAGIQAAKKTSELIPLCHPLPISNIDVKMEFTDSGISVASSVSCVALTGVEMEALTAVSVTLLTIYDMCKAVDKNMKIGNIALLEKIKETV